MLSNRELCAIMFIIAVHCKNGCENATGGQLVYAVAVGQNGRIVSNNGGHCDIFYLFNN